MSDSPTPEMIAEERAMHQRMIDGALQVVTSLPTTDLTSWNNRRIFQGRINGIPEQIVSQGLKYGPDVCRSNLCILIYATLARLLEPINDVISDQPEETPRQVESRLMQRFRTLAGPEEPEPKKRRRTPAQRTAMADRMRRRRLDPAFRAREAANQRARRQRAKMENEATGIMLAATVKADKTV